MPAGDGRARAPVSPALPRVRSRVGVDAAPDLRTERGVRILKSFVWAGQDDRLARLDAAVAIWRRDDDVPLLVSETAALYYLPDEGRRAVRDLLADAGVAFVETRHPTDGSHDYYGLFVAGHEVAHAEVHGAWLDWPA